MHHINVDTAVVSRCRIAEFFCFVFWSFLLILFSTRRMVTSRRHVSLSIGYGRLSSIAISIVRPSSENIEWHRRQSVDVVSCEKRLYYFSWDFGSNIRTARRKTVYDWQLRVHVFSCMSSDWTACPLQLPIGPA